MCCKVERKNAIQAITVVEYFKARNVFARSNSWIVGSNHNQCMNICVRLFSVCFVVCR
jgi:hypothetical protein